MKKQLSESINYKITTEPEDIVMGLFGGVTLFILEVLPYLKANSIYPFWDIKSINYGRKPDYTLIPGIFDLAYTPTGECVVEKKLLHLRRNKTFTLGNDWEHINSLWSSYFKIPKRIISKADEVGDLSKTLGLHYRGTDKKTSSWDTNPVSQDEFTALIKDFLQDRPSINSVFIATDEYSFVNKFRLTFPHILVLNLGEVESHLDKTPSSSKADSALLDCILLSRCRYVINTSSALSGFAKVFNPKLECYRVAASKLFGEMPYFPVAYIPKLTSKNRACKEILERLLKDDWLQDKLRNTEYEKAFAFRERSKGAIFLWKIRKKISLVLLKVKAFK